MHNTLRGRFPGRALLLGWAMIAAFGGVAHSHAGLDFKAVSNTRDSGPGSLRAALAYANDDEETRIIFQIPITDPNYDKKTGTFTIELERPLPPAEMMGTVFDGLAQTKVLDSNKTGPEVIISGRKLKPGTPGIVLNAPFCQVRGLGLTGFGDAIVVTGSRTRECRIWSNTIWNNSGAGVRFSAGAHANYVGLAPFPETGDEDSDSDEKLLGSPEEPGAGNFIYQNGGPGVWVDNVASHGNAIRGNFDLASNKGPAIRLAPGLAAPAAPKVIAVQRVDGARPMQHRAQVVGYGRPNGRFRLDLYWEAPTGGSESEPPVRHKSVVVMTDKSGKINTTVPVPGYPAGKFFATLSGLDRTTGPISNIIEMPFLH